MSGLYLCILRFLVLITPSWCLKITEKVSFNIYILSGQKFVKNAKKCQLKLEACIQTVLPDKDWCKMPDLKYSSWDILSHFNTYVLLVMMIFRLVTKVHHFFFKITYYYIALLFKKCVIITLILESRVSLLWKSWCSSGVTFKAPFLTASTVDYLFNAQATKNSSEGRKIH